MDTGTRKLNLEDVQLRSGELVFTAYSAGTGPTVFLLHGFPDCAKTFEAQFEPLVSAGFRVIAPMLGGYEPSSQPRDGRYHAMDMAQDLINWLDQLGLEQVHLIGHDWGAMIGQAAVLQAPGRFRSLTLLALPHAGRMRKDGFRSLKQL